MNKIIKWECFFVFDNGERESMWEINRIVGKNLRQHELDMLQEAKNNNTFVVVETYANGKKEI